MNNIDYWHNLNSMSNKDPKHVWQKKTYFKIDQKIDPCYSSDSSEYN